MKVFSASAALLAVVAPLAIAQTKPMVKSMDKTFVMNAGHSDAAEMSMAMMAKSKSKNPTVLRYADMMIKEHKMMHAELKKVAMDKATVPDKPNAKQMAMANKLKAMSGMAFDKAYMQANVMGHKEAYMNATKGAKMASDPAIKAFFAKGAPKIKMHLDMAEKDTKMMMGGKTMKPKPMKMDHSKMNHGG